VITKNFIIFILVSLLCYEHPSNLCFHIRITLLNMSMSIYERLCVLVHENLFLWLFNSFLNDDEGENVCCLSYTMGYLKYPEVCVCSDMTIFFLAGKIIESCLKSNIHTKNAQKLLVKDEKNFLSRLCRPMLAINNK